MTEASLVFTVGFPFCGLGAGARGFLDAQVRLFGRDVRFESLGGIDLDAMGLADFRMLTKSPTLEADVHTLTVERLRAFWPKAPDVIFMSPPCKGFSGLLSAKAAQGAKYRRMNGLVLSWIKLMLAAWPTPPKLVLLENVPRIESRGHRFLKAVRARLRKAGYVFSQQTHDCGELGGLGQHRNRFLLVARQPKLLPPLLYQPAKRRVRSCGEILEQLPMPGDPAAGPMHQLPRLSWLNWMRLALIPAGGDWRDLPGVLAEGQARRTVFRRQHTQPWTEPSSTVAGAGSNGPCNVADPRPRRKLELEGFGHVLRVQRWSGTAGTVTSSPSPSSGALAVADPRVGLAPDTELNRGTYGVRTWDEASGTVTGNARAATGSFSVADPRASLTPQAMNPNVHHNKHLVADWEKPARTVIGATRVGSGAPSVADPRAGRLGVLDPAAPAKTIAGESYPSNGAFSIADVRVKTGFDHAYGVLHRNEASPTVAGGTHPGQGAYAFADPRGMPPILPWTEAAKTIDGNDVVGGFALVDEAGVERLRVLKPTSPIASASGVPVVIAADGTWHRPLTTLELAALQGFPMVVDGKPLVLAGDPKSSSTAWRERIGNAVPPPAAKAIAEQMLVCLAQGELEAFALSSGGAVWVVPEEALAT